MCGDTCQEVGVGAGAAPTYSKEAVGCSTSKKFKRLNWGLAASCQGRTPLPPSRPPRAFTGVETHQRVPGAGPSPACPRPALLRAHGSPRWLPSPGLDRAPPRSTPGAAGFCAGSPGAGSRFPGSRGRGSRGGGGDRDGGGGGRVKGEEAEEEEEEAGRRRRRRRRRAAAAARARAAPPPPRERRAPRPGSHASHVRPLAAAAPRRRPRRVMRTDVKLPYEY